MKTPLLYSIVPIAPSKTTTCCGSSSRVINGFSGNRSLCFSRSARAGAANRVVLRFWMVDNHSGRRLLRHQLKRFGELHAERFLCREKPEDRNVVIEVRTGAIAPGVPFPRFESKFVLNALMRPLSDCFCRFHRQSVGVERLGVLVLRLQLLESSGGFGANGNDLQRQDIDVA